MSGEVTNQMMLGDRMYQAATQVNVLSPEIVLIVEVDAFHESRRQHCCNVARARKQQLYRGLRQWHDTKWVKCELGRSIGFSGKKTEYIKTSRIGQELMDDPMEVGLTGSTSSMRKPCTWGSGQQWYDRLKENYTRNAEVETCI
jgi:hypothetical protein